MPRDELAELRDALTATRQALKGLQRQARAALQLTTDLQERIDRYERAHPTIPQPQEAQDNGSSEEDRRLAAVG